MTTFDLVLYIIKEKHEKRIWPTAAIEKDIMKLARTIGISRSEVEADLIVLVGSGALTRSFNIQKENIYFHKDYML